MTIELTPFFLGFLTIVVLAAGVVNGLSGFGFAAVGTMALASVLDPATAVVLMIIPILAANLTLVNELSQNQLTRCGRRFAPLIVACILGTIVGMAVLDRLPEAPLRVGLGVVTLGFVVSRQQAIALPSVPFGSDPEGRERPVVMIAVGSVSGLLFGATNVGVQLVAYLRSLNLSHGLFVGVVAMVFVGINSIRVGAAGVFGLYPTLAVFGLSVAGAVPAVGGVALGSRLRQRLSETVRRRLVLGLLSLIGIRLIFGGLGIA